MNNKPFGFDPNTAYDELDEMPNPRIYLTVDVSWKKDGSMIPLSFTLNNRKNIMIDKVLECRKARSLKSCQNGYRYKCIV